MASFIVRVELVDSREEEYEFLDAEMEKRGFSKSLPNAEGEWFIMPTGEYFYQGHKTVGYICAMGEQAADTINRKARILAAEIVMVAFDLDPQKKA